MKNALLALALFAFAGSASAHDGKGPHDHGKKGAAKSGCTADMKSAQASMPGCSKSMASKPGCCRKGRATAAAEVKTPAAPVVKSL